MMMNEALAKAFVSSTLFATALHKAIIFMFVKIGMEGR